MPQAALFSYPSSSNSPASSSVSLNLSTRHVSAGTHDHREPLINLVQLESNGQCKGPPLGKGEAPLLPNSIEQEEEEERRLQSSSGLSASRRQTGRLKWRSRVLNSDANQHEKGGGGQERALQSSPVPSPSRHQTGRLQWRSKVPSSDATGSIQNGSEHGLTSKDRPVFDESKLGSDATRSLDCESEHGLTSQDHSVFDEMKHSSLWKARSFEFDLTHTQEESSSHKHSLASEAPSSSGLYRMEARAEEKEEAEERDLYAPSHLHEGDSGQDPQDMTGGKAHDTVEGFSSRRKIPLREAGYLRQGRTVSEVRALYNEQKSTAEDLDAQIISPKGVKPFYSSQHVKRLGQKSNFHHCQSPVTGSGHRGSTIHSHHHHHHDHHYHETSSAMSFSPPHHHHHQQMQVDFKEKPCSYPHSVQPFCFICPHHLSSCSSHDHHYGDMPHMDGARGCALRCCPVPMYIAANHPHHHVHRHQMYKHPHSPPPSCSHPHASPGKNRQKVIELEEDLYSAHQPNEDLYSYQPNKDRVKKSDNNSKSIGIDNEKKPSLSPPLPASNSAPFVLCQHCDKLLYYSPPHSPPPLPTTPGVLKLKCGSCCRISKFSSLALERIDLAMAISSEKPVEVGGQISIQPRPMPAAGNGQHNANGASDGERGRASLVIGHHCQHNANGASDGERGRASLVIGHLVKDQESTVDLSRPFIDDRVEGLLQAARSMEICSDLRVQEWVNSSFRENLEWQARVFEEKGKGFGSGFQVGEPAVAPWLSSSVSDERENAANSQGKGKGTGDGSVKDPSSVISGSPLHELFGYKSPEELLQPSVDGQEDGSKTGSRTHSSVSSSTSSSKPSPHHSEHSNWKHSEASDNVASPGMGPKNGNLYPRRAAFAPGHAYSRDADVENGITGFFKRGFKDLAEKTVQFNGGTKRKVIVNGQILSTVAVKAAEVFAGKLRPGSYWYDYKAGFWGVSGSPCLGIIPPYIQELNYPMSKDCSNGTTQVVVNGRELHQKDLDILSKRGLSRKPGKAYTIDFDGTVADEVTGIEVKNLGKLAPTVEKRGQGFGMFTPDTSAICKSPSPIR